MTYHSLPKPVEKFEMRIPTNREPIHPGIMLREEFLEPMSISQQKLADDIGIPYQRVNEIVNKRRGMTSSTALKLERYLGMPADFWLKLQMRWDLYMTAQKEQDTLHAIPAYAGMSAD